VSQAAHHRRIVHELGVEDLHRHAALDQPVLGEEHRPHTAIGDRPDDLVPAFDDFADFHQIVTHRPSGNCTD
jgi:hypothetical protein